MHLYQRICNALVSVNIKTIKAFHRKWECDNFPPVTTSPILPCYVTGHENPCMMFCRKFSKYFLFYVSYSDLHFFMKIKRIHIKRSRGRLYPCTIHIHVYKTNTRSVKNFIFPLSFRNHDSVFYEVPTSWTINLVQNYHGPGSLEAIYLPKWSVALHPNVKWYFGSWWFLEEASFQPWWPYWESLINSCSIFVHDLLCEQRKLLEI